MNTNYYTNIALKILKKQIIFVSLISFFIFTMLIKELQDIFILKDPSFQIKFNFLDEVYSLEKISIEQEFFSQIIIYYKAVSSVTIIALVNNIYERFLKDILTREKEVKWYDVKTVKYPYEKDELNLIIGQIHNEDNLKLASKPKYLTIDKDGLFQNVLITGTIGTGKTIALIAQILLQFIYKFHDNPDDKFAMLCLDVKGNFYKFVYAFAKEVGRWKDIITIQIAGKYRYNPLHKPNLSEIELANRCRYVVELFQGKNSDSYWLGKAEDFMVELFKLIRLYNDKYINFTETHKCGLDAEYRNQKIEEVNKRLENGELTEEEEYNFRTIVSYFKNEYDKQDEKIQGFILSSLTTMTQPFVSTKRVKDSFSPSKEEINFFGFEETIKEGKIVVFKINANKEPKVAKLISAYLKLDFQKEIMMSLDKGKDSVEAKRVKVTLCDEYQEYSTRNDAEFLSQSREPRSITVVATQSYSSIKQALGNDEVVTNMLLQSFVNKIWLRSDDVEYTIPKVIKQIGKVIREKISSSVTENAQKSRTNFSIGKVLGSGKNLSSGISVSEQKEDKFDEVFLGQKLKLGQAVAFISDGETILSPTAVHCPAMHKEGRIIYDKQKNKIKFTNNMKEVFESIGNIDMKKLEQKLDTKLTEKDMLDTTGLDELKNKKVEIKKEENNNLIFNNISDEKKEDFKKETNSDLVFKMNKIEKENIIQEDKEEITEKELNEIDNTQQTLKEEVKEDTEEIEEMTNEIDKVNELNNDVQELHEEWDDIL